MNGIFVTGTDTGVGKTLVSAWLAQHWRAAYWKPVQSGSVEGTDGGEVARLAPDAEFLPSAYVLKEPLSPHEAAAREGVRIDLAALAPPLTSRPLVVEGAGGVMVPLNDTALMIDLMAQLALPVLVVARSGLGTINHTLLTLAALRGRGLAIRGVIMNGEPNPANRRAIEHFGRVRVLAELPPLPAVTAEAIAALPAPLAFAPTE
ncbi:MAG: dethiobiotin synthase [Solirubrobacterales bacterium]